MRDARMIREQLGLPNLKTVAGDLVAVPYWQVGLSLLVPWFCLAIYVLAALAGWWPVAVLGVVLLSFFTYGSISHDLVHRNLRLGKRTNDLLLCVTELLALRSGHAYQAAHLHHHATFPDEDDVEGAASSMCFARTIVEGFILQPKIFIWAMRHDGVKKRWIIFEGTACVVILTTSIVVLLWTPAPLVYVALVVAGSWIIPLVTSYIPHEVHSDAQHDVHAAARQTRLFRGKALSLLAIEHLYHLEHHLYPQVPHHHWAELARRLDPYFEQAGLKAIYLRNPPERQTLADTTE